MSCRVRVGSSAIQIDDVSGRVCSDRVTSGSGEIRMTSFTSQVGYELGPFRCGQFYQVY